MLSVLFSVLSAIPGLAGKFFDWQVKKANVELDGFKTGAGVDLVAFQTYMAAQVDTNRMKLAQNSWWGAKLIILTAGIPASLHFAAVFLDTLIPPFGSWGVPKLPAPYDTYQWAIVQSFFLVMPVQTGINAVAQWLNRGR
jgi:hypothetical protein